MTGHVIVTGSGRSGTTIMGELLGTHPSLAYVHEQGRRQIRKVLGIPEQGWIDAEAAEAILAGNPEGVARLRDWAATAGGKLTLVDKEPGHVGRLPFLRRLWPEVRVVYMLRNPLDVVCSNLLALEKKRQDGPAWLAWCNPVLARQVAHLPMRHQILAWVCANQERDLQDMASDPLAHVVRYEHLLADPHRVAGAVRAWLGLREPGAAWRALCDRINPDPHDYVSPRSAGNFVPAPGGSRVERWRQEWSQGDLDRAIRAHGPHLASLGYAP